MTSKTYSIIIPHHNSPGLLDRCIKSIPERDDIQIIVVDDNSADDKKPVIKRSDVEVLFINAQDSKGAGHARNVGIEKAIGEWLLFADCDDYFADNFLSVLDGYVHSDQDVVFFNFKYVDSETGLELPQLIISRIVENFDGTPQKDKALRYMNNAPWSKMVRTSFVKNNRFEFEETINGNDFLFSLLVGHNANKYSVERNVVYIYTMNPTGLSNRRVFSDQELACKLAYIKKRQILYKKLSIKGPETSLIGFFLYVLRRKGTGEFLHALKILIKRFADIYKGRNCYYDAIIGKKIQSENVSE